MHFSSEFITKLKDTVDLHDLVSRYTSLRRVGHEWVGRCPSPHHEDKNPSFCVWHKNGTWGWSCMSCCVGPKDGIHNFGTDCIAFIQWLSAETGRPKTFQEAVRFLADLYHIPLEESRKLPIYQQTETACRLYQSQLNDEAKAYLHARGVTDEAIAKWRLGWQDGRIMIPVRGRDKEVLGFTGRSVTDEKPKYKTSPTTEIFKMSSLLFGQEYRVPGPVFITEGVFDVILADMYGVPNVMASFGCHLSDDQIRTLLCWKQPVVLCYDGDAAGRKGILAALRELSKQGLYASVLTLPNGVDLADLAIQVRENLVHYMQSHTYAYWRYILDEPGQSFSLRLTAMQRDILPMILDARQSVQTDAEQVLFRTYVRDTFKMELNHETVMEPAAAEAASPAVETREDHRKPAEPGQRNTGAVQSAS